MNWPDLINALIKATGETFYMVGVSALLTALIGLPLGVLLVITEPGHLMSRPKLNVSLGAIINIGRSLPFIILMLVVAPLTRFVTGTTIGSTAAIVPLTVAAIPFFARIVEASLKEVDRGLIEAAQAMGCSTGQVITKVLLPEARPGLTLGLAITVISLIGYSAMAGTIGGGGLGDLAYRYGYQRYKDDVLWASAIVLIIVVQLIQSLGDWAARRLSKK